MRLSISFLLVFFSSSIVMANTIDDFPFLSGNSRRQTSPPLGSPQAVAQVNQEIETLISQNSSCENTQFGNRGRLSQVPGYFQGMLFSFIRSACRPSSDIVQTHMVRGQNSTRWDGLAPHFNGQNNQDSRNLLISTSLLTLSMGMRESTGRYWSGVDVTNSSSMSRAVSAEAGLFQTSYDVRGIGHGEEWVQALEQLEQFYRDNPSLCLVEEFSEGMNPPASPRQGIGSGVGRDFQDLMRNCPALAAEHAMITSRHNRRHYGPLRRNEARPVETCRPLYETLYQNTQNNPAYCQAYGVPMGESAGTDTASVLTSQ